MLCLQKYPKKVAGVCVSWGKGCNRIIASSLPLPPHPPPPPSPWPPPLSSTNLLFPNPKGRPDTQATKKITMVKCFGEICLITSS